MTLAGELRSRLEAVESLVVVCHENPDPDALSSALALETIAHELGVGTVTLTYGGEVSHQQNRVFINTLDIQLRVIDELDLGSYDAIALVDHAGYGTAEYLPADRDPTIVIDHHQPAEDVRAEFVDVRPGYGSTAAILVEYLREFEVTPSVSLASGLLFALHRERLDYMRSPSVHEYDAARYVFPQADVATIERMYDSEFTPVMVDTVAAAITHREVRGSALATTVGRTTERDALVQAADFLLNLEGIETVLVAGIVEGTIHVSARSMDLRVNIGELLREAFSDVGEAGGHRDMAAAQLPLGLFADEETDDDALDGFVARRVTRRFFGAMNLSSEPPGR